MTKYLYLLMLTVFLWPTNMQANSDTIVACRDTTVCLMQSDFEIKVCTPYGGHYFGPGVKDTVENTYVPFWAGTGIHEVTYRIGTFSCQVKVTIIDLVQAGSITGNVRICGGGADELYQIPADTTAVLYHWKITQWHDFKDSTAVPHTTIHFDETFVGGTLQASVRNQCGEGAASNVQIQVKPNPVPVIKNLSDTLSQADDVCQNQLLSYYAYGEFDSCRWTIQGGTFTGPDTSRLAIVKWGTVAGNGTLGISAYKEGCLAAFVRSVSIGDGMAPDPAKIWLFGYNMLVCSDSTAGSYCWFQDNNVYEGYVSPSGRYILPEPLNKQSNYHVRTSLSPTCTTCYTDSEPFNFSKTGIDEPARSMRVSPNPAQHEIEMRFNSNTAKEGLVSLYSQYGKLVWAKHIISCECKIDISFLLPGFYIIDFVEITGVKHTSRIIKL